MTVEAVLLGVAQDGGVPHAGCYCATCQEARRDHTKVQWVVCLGLIDGETRQSWLIDATPDFPRQLHALHDLAPDHDFAGIILTHAHAGHYTGLIHLGREIMATRHLPVYTTERMAAFLRQNQPWAYLIQQEHISLKPLSPTTPTQLSPRLTITPYPVPHRQEFSDTVALVVAGQKRRLFYCPDIDRWNDWDHGIRLFLDEIDVALLDGCFYSAAELPHRNLAEIAHPLVTDTAARLSGTRCEVHLIHLNHSNPLYGEGPEQAQLAEQGIRIGSFGQRWVL